MAEAIAKPFECKGLLQRTRGPASPMPGAKAALPPVVQDPSMRARLTVIRPSFSLHQVQSLPPR